MTVGYATRGRAEELERKIAAVEARCQERIDRLERELADARASQVQTVRAIVQGLVESLKPKTEGGPKP